MVSRVALQKQRAKADRNQGTTSSIDARGLRLQGCCSPPGSRQHRRKCAACGQTRTKQRSVMTASRCGRGCSTDRGGPLLSISGQESEFDKRGRRLDVAAIADRSMISANGGCFSMSKQDDNKAVVGRWFTEFWGKTVDRGVIDKIAAPDMLLKYSLHEPRGGRADIKALDRLPRRVSRSQLLGHCGSDRRGRLRRRSMGEAAPCWPGVDAFSIFIRVRDFVLNDAPPRSHSLEAVSRPAGQIET